VLINTQLLVNKNIILHGTGNAAKKLIHDLANMNITPLFCLDNNHERWGELVDGINIINPICITEMDRENTLIIISSMYYQEIKDQLCLLGLVEEQDFTHYKSLYQYPLQWKYDCIRKKYDLFYRDGRIMVKYIESTLQRIPDGKKTAIWGVGEHTEKLLQVIEHCISVEYIIDPDLNHKVSGFTGIKVIAKNEVSPESIDIILLSVFDDRKAVRKQLIQQYPDIEIIDFYEVFDGKIVCSRPFYMWDHIRYQIFMEVHLLRCQIQEEKRFESLLVLYKHLFEILLQIKDFDQLNVYIQEYSRAGFPDAEIFLQLNHEIETLLRSAEEKMQNRKHKDIILFIFDSMRYQDHLNSPYINSLRTNSFEFQNAFSTSTYTRASFMAMFSKHGEEEQDFSSGIVDGSESSLFAWLEDNNYLMFQHGEKEILNVESLQHVHINEDWKWQPFTSRIWEMTCRLSHSDAPQFHIVNAIETHHPFLCTKHPGIINFDYIPYQYYEFPDYDYSGSIKQLEEAISYIDESMRRFHSLLSHNTLSIISSDHGSRIGKGPIGHIFTCDDDTIHVPLLIHRHDFDHKILSELYSHRNMAPLIISVMENDDVDASLFSNYVIVERDPIRMEICLSNKTILQNLGDWIHAFKMVRNHEYKYILFQNGNERLYKNADEQTNLLNDSTYSAVLEELREKISPIFPYNR
jgi:hypothetical protein